MMMPMMMTTMVMKRMMMMMKMMGMMELMPLELRVEWVVVMEGKRNGS
jgi:hypothetical protein